MTSPLLYTPEEVAKMMSISRSQVYNLMNSNQLESVHIGRSRRITIDQIRNFIDNLTVQKHVSVTNGDADGQHVPTIS